MKHNHSSSRRRQRRRIKPSTVFGLLRTAFAIGVFVFVWALYTDNIPWWPIHQEDIERQRELGGFFGYPEDPHDQYRGTRELHQYEVK